MKWDRGPKTMTILRVSALRHLPYGSVEGLEYLWSIVIAEMKGTNRDFCHSDNINCAVP